MKYELQRYVDLSRTQEFTPSWLSTWIKWKTYKDKKSAVNGFLATKKKAMPYEKYRLRAVKEKKQE